jgi:hypothetical protein
LKPILLPASLILLLFTTFPTNVQSATIPFDYKPDEPAPAQSTSGPRPPLGVFAPSRAPMASPTAVQISDVPAYYWRHGCGPTALGMVVGYYDIHGYPWLIPGDSSTQTNDVDEAIASQNTPSGLSNHYEDYSKPIESGWPPQADRSSTPPGDEHISNSIADFMFTSFASQSNLYGWSWSNHVGPAMVNYVHLKQPAAGITYTDRWWSSSLWSQYQTEINANRPVVFLVDSDGNGGTDHFITGIGYDEVTGVKLYATWDTWYDTVRWEPFVQMQNGSSWGIYQMTTFSISYSNPVPGFSLLQPSFTTSGHADLTIQLTGDGFIETSIVRWNGGDLQTNYISPNRLVAVIPAVLLITPGSDTVTIYTPAPGGGTSAGLPFTIYDEAAFTHKGYLPVLFR